MRFLIFGAGAIGTYIGGSLALIGQRVTFVERPETARELRRRGLRLDLTADRRRRANETLLIPPSSVTIAESLEEALQYLPFDAAIFALKSFDTAPALEAIRPFVRQLPPFVCLSNGVENETLLASVLGAEKVIPGTVTSAIGRRAAGDAILEKLRGVGLAAGHPLSPKLVTLFNLAHLNARLFADPAAMKWSKLLTNLIANATSAILNLPPERIFADPRLYWLEIAMLREALAVMQAQNIPLADLPQTPVRALAWAVRWPLWLSQPLLRRAIAGGRGGKMPSFHIDLHSGRGQSEVDYLNGAVVRAGERVGVLTPVNRLLTQTLLALTRGERPLEEFSGKPDALLALFH